MHMTDKLERIWFILEINKTQFKTTIINKKRKTYNNDKNNMGATRTIMKTMTMLICHIIILLLIPMGIVGLDTIKKVTSK